MAARGQNTRVIVGRTSVGVSLVKMSQAPTDAKHEVKRFQDEAEANREAAAARARHPEADPTAFDPDDYQGEDPFGEPDPEPAPTPAKPAPPVSPVRVEQGVTLENGTWVNLTDKLAAIDERCKIDGMEIEATIPTNQLPRTWVREAYYIVPSDPHAAKFLARIWTGLVPSSSAAIVRWTKKTDQFVGAIIARGNEHHGKPFLVLVELEWPENLRDLPLGAVLDTSAVEHDSRGKAVQAMRALRKSITYMDELHDERRYQRRELLEATRNQKTWTPPEEVQDTVLAEVQELLRAA